MYNQSLIDCIAYSLWLDSVDSLKGQLILGGVDTGKFLGTLETVPVVMNDLQYKYVSIEMQGLAITLGDNTTINLHDGPLQVSPDSGTTEILLPSNVTNAIYEYIGATYDDNLGVAVLDCDKADIATTLDFTIGSTIISVPLGDLLIADSGAPKNESCAVLLGSSDDLGLSLLGIAFIRQSYIVYDFSHNQLSVAQANFNTTTNNVTAIGPNGVIGLQGVTVGSPTSSTSTDTPHGLSTGAKAGIGGGVAAGALLLLVVIAILFLGRRRLSDPAANRKSFVKPELEATSGYQPSQHEDSKAKLFVPPIELEAPEKVSAPQELPPNVIQELGTGQAVGHELEADGRRIRRKPVPSSTDSKTGATNLR
jgi:hypothetical protein